MATLVKPQPVLQKTYQAVKMIAAGLFGVGYLGNFLDAYPILRAIASYGFTFYAAQVSGELTNDYLDQKIERNKSIRIGKTALLTLLHLAAPIGFAPWSTPRGEERLKQLPFVGLALGFANGVIHRSSWKRFERVPVEKLKEFESLEPPSPTQRMQYMAYRVWKICVPLISISAITGFMIWQQGFQLNELDQRLALGTLYGGFMSSYMASKWVDRTWDAENRHPRKDWMMANLWAPRLLGMPLWGFFFPLTNALRMEADLMGNQPPQHIAAIVAAYLSYGMEMGRISAVVESDRKGNPQLKNADLLFINGAMTVVPELLKA
jgi:hypothetical protein